jgi:outer membrane protein OmpA-like peptidoglycan-associated protein
MNKQLFIILFLPVVLTVSLRAHAQIPKQQCPNEWNVWAAGGWQALYYQTSYGSREDKAGGIFGLGYGHYFSEHWGFLLGMELSLYQSGFKMNNLHDNYDAADLDPYHSQKINFRYHTDNYKETQQLLNLNIPLMLQYQTYAWNNNRIYTAFGFKLGIPLESKYRSKNTTVTSTGYYYDWWQELDDEREYLGFGIFNNQPGSGKLNSGLSCIGTVEAGIKWNLGNKTDLYTGVYFDYGFNNIVKGDRHKQFVEYCSYETGQFKTINSTLNSQYTYEQGGETKTFTGKVSPIALGLKLRLGIGTCPKSKTAEKEDAPEKPSKEKETLTPEQARKAKLRAMINRPADENEIEMEEAGSIMPDEKELKEEQRRAVSEYGSSVRGVINVEMEGYELDQSILTPRMERILDNKIAQIRETYGSNISIVCEGHTCDVGNDAYNMKLGQKRAEEVRKFLINKGFSSNRVIATSKGQYSPVVPNTNEVNQKKNRRVMLIIRD